MSSIEKMNGNYFRYTTCKGEIGFSFIPVITNDLVDIKKINFRPISALVSLASNFGAVTKVLTKDAEIVGASFTINNVNVVCIQDGEYNGNKILHAYIENLANQTKQYIDLSDTVECEIVLNRLKLIA